MGKIAPETSHAVKMPCQFPVPPEQRRPGSIHVNGSAPRNGTKRGIAALEEEIARLQCENDYLRLKLEIIKKTVGILLQSPVQNSELPPPQQPTRKSRRHPKAESILLNSHQSE